MRGALGLLLTVSAATAAQAQAPQAPVTIGTTGGDVTVIADRLEQVGPENLYVATGSVELIKGATRLMADRIELNRATGEAVAQGRVIFYDGEDQLTGQRIEYNVKTGTGVVYQAEARSAPYYRLSGEQMERLGDSLYRVTSTSSSMAPARRSGSATCRSSRTFRSSRPPSGASGRRASSSRSSASPAARGSMAKCRSTGRSTTART